MPTAFALMFWGLVLVVFDFSIDGFDLLPDGIGYLIVAAGCRKLVNQSQHFATARILCFVLAALWLIGFAVNGDLELMFGLSVTASNAAMIWFMLGGIAEYTSNHGRLDLTKRAINRRIAYVVIIGVSSAVSLTLNGPNNAAPLVILLVVAFLILVAMILHLVHRVKVEVARGPLKPVKPVK